MISVILIAGSERSCHYVQDNDETFHQPSRVRLRGLLLQAEQPERVLPRGGEGGGGGPRVRHEERLS